jgi:hypothetical protein
MSETREGIALKHWTIDKRVPLALILTISIQTCGIVWWASGLTTRVEQLEKQAAAMAPQDTRLTRVEVRLDNVVDGISEIKALLRPPTTILPK